MARRGRSNIALTATNDASAGVGAASSALLYTAQDVAHFCEVDLKTIHHWADAGKIPHHRTDGRHLRFRRNHVIRFLEAHGYPLHSALTSARPSVYVALPQLGLAESTDEVPSLFKRLAVRFAVRRFESAIVAIANLALGEPDAMIFALDDTSWSPPATIAALKSHNATAHPAIIVVARSDTRENDAMGADLVLPDVTKLPTELAKLLRVD